MKELGIGCVGVLFGAFVGAALTLFGVTLLNTSASPGTQSIVLPSRPDVTISASAPYVTSQMEQAIAESGIGKQSTISLLPPNRFQVRTTVSINFLGSQVPVDVSATFSTTVQRGRAVVEVEQVDAGGVTLPGDVVAPMVERLRAQGEDQLNRTIQQNLQGTGLHLVGIRISADAVSLDLSSR